MSDLGAATEQAVLTHLGGNGAWPAPTEWWVLLHVGDPSDDGIAFPAIENTSMELINGWNAPTLQGNGRFQMAATDSPVAVWTTVAATETYRWVSVWNGDPGLAGAHLFNCDIDDTPVSAGGTFTLTALVFGGPTT